MGNNKSQPKGERQDEWQEHEDFGNGVRTMVMPNRNPVLVAVFDGDERVTEPTAALQLDNHTWAADAYSDAKAKYSEDIDNEQDDK